MSEKIIKTINGYMMLLFILVLLATAAYNFIVFDWIITPALLGVFAVFLLKRLYLSYPNRSMVMTLFGSYRGTAKDNGLFWTNPLYAQRGISLRARNFDSERL